MSDATVYVSDCFVSEAEARTAAVKTDLKTQLSEIYNAYGENYYTAEDWQSVCSFYETGISQIEASLTCKEMGEAYELASKGIEKIQNVTTNSTADKLSYFRSILNRLPDDVSNLNNSLEHLFVDSGEYSKKLGLINTYKNFTEYQRTFLILICIKKHVNYPFPSCNRFNNIIIVF